VDSGASHHLSPHLEHFAQLTFCELTGVTLADDTSLPVVGKGDVILQGASGPVILKEVHYVPHLSMPLMAVAPLLDRNGRVKFLRERVLIYASGHETPVLSASRKGNAWYLGHAVIPPRFPVVLPKCQSDNLQCCIPCASAHALWGTNIDKGKGTWASWHARLGHLVWNALC
jgi:hypothetical protein